MAHDGPGGDVLNRRMITVTVMLVSVLQTLDNTIANVALPHMQGSLSATQEQIAWVLTSYIIAAAIMTPLTGWLAAHFGRRQLFLYSVVGFILTSALCGVSQSLPQVVTFRLLQGLAGAALVPISQAVLLDINPPEHHGRAMSTWAQAVVIGPMVGPVLGGWLTENYSWRWCFFINVPLGILGLLGVLRYFPRTTRRESPFDFFGFAMLAVAIASLQLMLDRGSLLDWFDSTEICIEAVVSGLAFFLFAVHSATSRQPFIRPALFKDRNFLTGCVFIFTVGIVMFATLALLPTMLQSLLNYPVLLAGELTAPRSLGTLFAMMVVGRTVTRVDPRWIIAGGFTMTALSLWQMTQFSTQMNGSPIFWSGFVQGLGTGAAYVPMATLAFGTLPGVLRDEGAAMFSLMRNIGSSVGISMVQALLVRNTQIVHASLAEHVTPYNLAARDPQLAAQLASPDGLAAFNAEMTRQASMIGYIDNFHLMLILTLLSIPLLLLVRRPKPSKATPAVVIE